MKDGKQCYRREGGGDGGGESERAGKIKRENGDSCNVM